MFKNILQGSSQASSAHQETLCAIKNSVFETSLVVQWLRLSLLMQGLWVRSLVRELKSIMLQGMAKN